MAYPRMFCVNGTAIECVNPEEYFENNCQDCPYKFDF